MYALSLQSSGDFTAAIYLLKDIPALHHHLLMAICEEILRQVRNGLRATPIANSLVEHDEDREGEHLKYICYAKCSIDRTTYTAFSPHPQWYRCWTTGEDLRMGRFPAFCPCVVGLGSAFSTFAVYSVTADFGRRLLRKHNYQLSLSFSSGLSWNGAPLFGC